MAIFPILECEGLVQGNDKTRLDASKSFVSNGPAITLVEIEPKAGAGFIDVTTAKFLDWAYAFTGMGAEPVEETITLRVTAGVSGQVTVTKKIKVISEVADKLFSADQDLVAHEPDILKYVPKGRATYLNVHRRAQSLILAWLDKEGYTDAQGNKLTKASLPQIDEVKEWSVAMTLRLIFEGLSNAKDDVFAIKAKRYEGLETEQRSRAVLRLDLDGDGEATASEETSIRGAIVVRR